MTEGTIPETPAVIVDMDQVEANIHRAQGYFDGVGLNLRPHIKTHKISAFAKLQIAAGAVGITCQKIGEAEVMADAGLNDILITYNILGDAKLQRLIALARRVATLSVTADNGEVISGLSEAFGAAGLEIGVLVECDTGGGRCGVQSAADALRLAHEIVAAPAVRFGGLMVYPAIGGETATSEFLADALELLARDGIDCPVVSGGGSPGMWRADTVPHLTEYRVGTNIFGDRSMVARGVYNWGDCALAVRTTVVSRPQPNKAIIDAGSKVFSSDLLGMEGFGRIADWDNILFEKMSEEHGVLTWATGEGPSIGDVLEITPNHCCVVANLANEVTLTRKGSVISTQKIEARGKTQ